MPHADIIEFDIAAVFVMAVCLLSFLMRRLTKRPSTRVYYACMVLVLATAIACIGGELYDYFLGPALVDLNLIDPQYFLVGRSALTLLFYALRSLTAPAYLILIATVSDTTYRLNNSTLKRIALWTPMIAAELFVLTNPLHHMVYFYDGGTSHRGPLIVLLYAIAAYYCIYGIAWTIRWREAFDENELPVLMMLYPIIFISVYVQYYFPYLRIDMFATAIAMMMISAFVIPPEKHVDTHVKAANLLAYREKCRHAFLVGRPLCIVYVEMVNLEQIRELRGKDELQDILRQVSERLTGTLSNDDVLYYLRNGLFCIIPRSTDPARALAIAKRTHEEGVARAREEQARGEGLAHGGLASGGLMDRGLGGGPPVMMRTCVVRFPEDASDIETLRRFVKRFSHLVPESTVTSFAELSKRPGFDLEMAVGDAIENAIEKHAFEVHYQPIYCLKDSRFHSAEALVRLRDPRFGWIPPSLFIPEAEQNGTILAIGDILIEKICAFLSEINYSHLQLDYVEVNLSVDQCVQPDMAEKLLGVMDKYGVEHGRMNLEITETSATYSQQAIENNVRKLAHAGLTFSLDDFGTGYSNVSRSLNLPFSLVKIDKSLVDGMNDPDGRSVLADTIAMMKRIGKEVLAEGVETQEQVEILRDMGVDYIQGYLFSKPLPEKEFVAFLERDADAGDGAGTGAGVGPAAGAGELQR